jgi:hypothetical protein
MKKLLRWMNLGLIVFTLFIYLLSAVDPAKFWPAAFLGLFWPFVILGNFIIALLWFYRKKWYGLLSLLCIFVVWSSVERIFNFNGVQDVESGKSTIEAVSYNVRAFKGLSKSSNELPVAIKEYFAEQEIDADIYCFQEGGKRDWKSIADALGMKKRWISSLGNTVILSRYDVVGKGELDFGKTTNSCVYLDLKISGNIYRVYNVHFQSNKISTDAEVVVNEKRYSDKTLIRRIMSRYKQAVIIRSEQVKKLREHIDDCSYPVIICGDFNDQPMSYVYKHLMNSDRVQDGFTERGSGLGTSYNGVIPALRIDYILADKGLEQLEYKRIKPTFSDHFAIFSKLQVE